MAADGMCKVSDEDKQKSIELWHDIRSKAVDLTRQVQSLKKRVKDGEFDTSQGVTFLEAKYQVLLGYITDLTFLMDHKLHGKSIKDHPSIDRLVEMRTVLEKMRPIDQKLKYQIDKLIKTASSGSAGSNDPLRFRANPQNLIGKLDEQDSEEEEDETSAKPSSGIYRPPKLAAMHYEGDETVQEKREQEIRRAKKRALSSSIMSDIREELDKDRPTEIKEQQDLYRARADRQEKERTEYEESMFVRKMLTKKEKHASRQLQTMSSLNTITHFGNMSALYGKDSGGAPAKKKKKGPSKKKGKKKGRKRNF